MQKARSTSKLLALKRLRCESQTKSFELYEVIGRKGGGSCGKGPINVLNLDIGGGEVAK